MTEVEDLDSLACINAHGTATLYNDDMESNAIHRAGLTSVTVNSLKGYYGHTMGAAGLLAVLFFLFILVLGLAYAWRKGALKWQ